jgi:MFS family permease
LSVASKGCDLHEHDTVAGPWSPASRRLTAGLLLAATATAFETLAVATVLPAVVNDLGALELYGWAFSAFLLTNLLTIAVAGGEIDRLGPARPFGLGIALFIAGLLIAGLAPSMFVVILARAMQGAGSGVLAAVASAVVGQAYSAEARPRMLALLSTAWVVPGLSGPAVAGVIAELAGWRWVFLGILPLPFLAGLLVLPAIRHLAPDTTRSPDWKRVRSAALLAAAMGTLLAGLGQASPLAIPLIALGIMGLSVALRNLLPVDVGREAPELFAAVAVMGLLSVGFYGVEAFIPLLLTDIRGQSIAVGGLPLTASAMTWAAGAWILERRGSSHGRRTMVWLGLALIAVGILGVGTALSPQAPPLVVFIAWTIAGLGVGLAYATVQLITLEITPPARLGVAVSTLQLVHTAAIALATGIGGALIATFSSGGHVRPASLAMQGALMLLAVVMGITVATRLPK